MVGVKESFPFTEATLKVSSIEELSLTFCTLKVEDSLDPQSKLRTLELKYTDFFKGNSRPEPASF
jgi:hypothetical protein